MQLVATSQTANIKFNTELEKYVLEFNGIQILKSQSVDYLKMCVDNQSNKKILSQFQ